MILVGQGWSISSANSRTPAISANAARSTTGAMAAARAQPANCAPKAGGNIAAPETEGTAALCGRWRSPPLRRGFVAVLVELFRLRRNCRHGLRDAVGVLGMSELSGRFRDVAIGDFEQVLVLGCQPCRRMGCFDRN